MYIVKYQLEKEIQIVLTWTEPYRYLRISPGMLRVWRQRTEGSEGRRQVGGSHSDTS